MNRFLFRPFEAAPDSARLAVAWAITVGIHALVALLSVRYSWFVGFRSASPFSDLGLFHDCARQVLRGSWPYRDFTIEYPPLAIPFFVVPLWITTSLGQGINNIEAYQLAFVGEMILVDAITVALVVLYVARTEGIKQVAGRLAWYTAYFAILCPLAVTRFDLVPMLVSFAAAVAFDRGWLTSGAVAAGLGVLVKVVPGLMILPAVTGSNPRPIRQQVAMNFGLVFGIGTTAWLLLGGDKSLDSVRYHLEREIEINSLYASGYMVAHALLGTHLSNGFGHGSLNVIAAGSAGLARVTTLVQMGCWLLVCRQAYRSNQPYSIRLAGAAVVGYLVGGKVLSPQYLVWLIPFAAVAGSGRWLFLGCCLLTTLVYPWMWGAMANFAPLPVSLLLIRNLSLVGLFVLWLQADPHKVTN